MVAQNPVFHGRGGFLRKFNATVINDIWPEVFFFTAFATMVTLISEMTRHKLAVSSALLGVLGTVLGLVISFRTSSAYERYQEGRKMWTNITIASRNLAQLIWINVPVERKQQTNLQSIIEKKSMVNLVQAFSVAVKHFLRGENGVYYQDLYPLISFLPRYANSAPQAPHTDADLLPLWQASEDGEHPYEHEITHRSPSGTVAGSKPPSLNNSKGSWLGSKRRMTLFDPEKTLPDVNTHRPLRPARNPPRATAYDYLPFLLVFKPIVRLFRPKKNDGRNSLGRKVKPALGDSNVPLEITLYLSNYVGFVLRGSLVPAAVASALVGNVSSLQDTLTNLERIASTPLPFAYQAHLRMSLWLYLLLLPFQIWSSFHYFTIPATAFTAFLYIGFLEIGQEIENPFNYDLNDLDLDTFCLAIQRELHEITAHTSPDPAEFLFSGWNQPFAPADRRGADVLSTDENYKHASSEAGIPSIRNVLLKNWKDVDQLTRHHH